jgi:N-ethylmaleimide reductase
MADDLLFSSFQLGPTLLKNRIVMSPMTRSRSIGNVPGEIVAKYYAQRAEAGLIVTEGTSPSPDGLGYPRIPGLFNAAQVAGWKRVTSAVHAAGSYIFVQLMHTGRVSHPGNLAPGGVVRAPSAVAAPAPMWVDAEGKAVPTPVPAEMTDADIERAIEEYARSAALAMEAGFDGVELHGANGYLIDQFLNTASNLRTDSWGGSVGNRARFALEVAGRTAARIGADRLGIRLSPFGAFNGMKADANMESLYVQLARGLSALKLVYIHIVDHSSLGAPPLPESMKPALRAAFTGKIILSGGYDRERAEKDLEAKRGDLVAFGRPFLANPKLVTKLREGRSLTPPDMATFYTPGEKGYTDYSLD